ncbi:MAG: rod shape determining protein RodA [Pseudohongiellaceae bacterium]|jgi:rod shape determining protein RodA
MSGFVGLRRGDIAWTVVVPALCLAAIGMIFIHSATAESSPSLWMRQLLFVCAGVAAVLGLCLVGVHRLCGASMEIYAVLVCILLLMPFFAEPTTVGSDRWIRLPLGFKLQPSEFMKLGLVLALARHLRHRGVTKTWGSYLPPFLLMALPWVCVARQPDLGSSLVLLPVFVAMVSVSGARLRHVVMLGLGSVILVLLAYHTPGVLKPYQKERLDSFRTSIPARVSEAREMRLAREHDRARVIEQEISRLKRGTGFQQFYSVVAIGSGGLTGAGLGEGLQNRSNRLPVRHSDFIYAVIGEEWGLAGTVTVVLLYMALTAGILGVAHRTREPYGRLVCVGVGSLIAGQAFMNLGIATGMLPVTGLPLPLVSYGGSSTLATSLGLGCVLDVARRRTSVFFEQ